MAIRTYDILLDSYNSTIPEPIVGRQGDKNGAVTLHVSITDRGTAVDLTGQTIILMAETAKGTAIIADNLGVTLTDAVNGKFDYAIPNALWSESGKIKRAYFSLNDIDGQQTTYDLIFIVKKAIDIDQKHADDYVTIIDGTLRSLKEKIDAMNTDVQTVLNAYNQGNFYNKSETDSKDAATLASAKSYADAGDSATLASAKSYVDKDNYYTKAEVDTKLKTLVADTGWVKVTGINGWNVDISVRLRDGVIYHKGNFSAGGDTHNIRLTVFKYPDSFGDLSSFNQLNGAWEANTSDGYTNYGFLKGATKEFFCWKKNTTGEASVSNITFKL